MLDEGRLAYIGRNNIIFFNERNFEILKLLIDNKGKVVTVKDMALVLYGNIEVDVYIRDCIKQRMYLLRKKVKEEFEISTVRGLGYCIK